MWGFDTAGSVGEETVNPRKNEYPRPSSGRCSPRAWAARSAITAFMAVGNLKASELSTVGLTYVVKSVLGTFLGDTLLVCVTIAIFVCCLANQTGAVRMIFAMARDNGFPGSHRLARISERDKTPVVPVVSVAVIAVLVLLFNIRQPQVFLVVTSTTVVLALIAYVLVVGPFALLRIRGKWFQTEKGYFSLGRAGLAVSIAAFIWGVGMIVNIAWPRRAIYNPVAPFRWWLQWGGILFPAIFLAIAFLVYWFVQRHKIGILAEHATDAPPADTGDRRSRVAGAGNRCRGKDDVTADRGGRGGGSGAHRDVDVAVVGGGVLGTAIAARVAATTASVCLLEAETDVAEGASKGNAGVAVAYDGPPGTDEAGLIAASHPGWEELTSRLSVPYRRLGAVMVALDEEQAATLEHTRDEVRACGARAELLTPAQARDLEPSITTRCVAGLSMPDEGVIDPMALTVAYAQLAAGNGAVIRLSSPVTAIEADETGHSILTTSARIRARFVVNAAGVAAGHVAAGRRRRAPLLAAQGAVRGAGPGVAPAR